MRKYCVICQDLVIGSQMHDHAIKHGIPHDLFLRNTSIFAKKVKSNPVDSAGGRCPKCHMWKDKKLLASQKVDINNGDWWGIRLIVLCLTCGQVYRLPMKKVLKNTHRMTYSAVDPGIGNTFKLPGVYEKYRTV